MKHLIYFRSSFFTEWVKQLNHFCELFRIVLYNSYNLLHALKFVILIKEEKEHRNIYVNFYVFKIYTEQSKKKN